MAIQVSYPGVYIEEFTPGAPIEGVGTSTAAFLGPWQYGEPNRPEKLYSWNDFLRKFSNPANRSALPIPAQDDYLWYAVKGFFENGGRICYVVRVSNAKYDQIELMDASDKPTIAIRARNAKDHSPNPIDISITHSSQVETELFNPLASLAEETDSKTSVLKVGNGEAIQFRRTDALILRSGTNSELTTVAGIVGGDLIKLENPLINTYPAGTPVALADPDAKTTVLRVNDNESMKGLTAGSVIKLAEGKSGSTSGSTTEVHATVISFSPEVMSTLKTWRMRLQDPLGKGFKLSQSIKLTSEEFDLKISHKGIERNYAFLSMDPGHPSYYEKVINNDDPNGLIYATPVEPPNTTTSPDNRPKPVNKTLSGGEQETREKINESDYKEALNVLALINDVNIIAAPGITSKGIQRVLIEHCEDLKDRFAILDTPSNLEIQSILKHREEVDSVNGYAALYFPWLRVSGGAGNSAVPALVPPSGHIAGLFARIDNNRGVHKAPAGKEAVLKSVLDVEKIVSNTELGDMNKVGINVVRKFQPGEQPIVWGARTTATEKDWRYVNIRRLFLFLEESIQEGIRWAVFEPNNHELWKKLKRTITAFLRQQWRDGALFGETEGEAFYVQIDDALNPQDQLKLGRLTIEIGVSPAYPAEFIVVRIGIWDGGAEIIE